MGYEVQSVPDKLGSAVCHVEKNFTSRGVFGNASLLRYALRSSVEGYANRSKVVHKLVFYYSSKGFLNLTM